MLTAEFPVQVTPAPYVTLQIAEVMTGYSVKAMERKIERGDWIEGREWRRSDDGRALIDIAGYAAWVVSGYQPTRLAPPIGSTEGPPRRTALYRHFDASARLLYVGVSFAPLERMRQHEDRSHWVHSIARMEIEWHTSRCAALDAEEKAIRSEAPFHNIVFNPLRERRPEEPA